MLMNQSWLKNVHFYKYSGLFTLNLLGYHPHYMICVTWNDLYLLTKIKTNILNMYMQRKECERGGQRERKKERERKRERPKLWKWNPTTLSIHFSLSSSFSACNTFASIVLLFLIRQSSRVPRAISYGWTKADCDAAAAKHPCQKCKCTWNTWFDNKVLLVHLIV